MVIYMNFKNRKGKVQCVVVVSTYSEAVEAAVCVVTILK